MYAIPRKVGDAGEHAVPQGSPGTTLSTAANVNEEKNSTEIGTA